MLFSSHAVHPIKVQHAMRGRIRFKIACLKGRQTGFETLKDRLQDLEGINYLRANPVAVSLVVVYDSGRLDESRVIALVRQAVEEEGCISCPADQRKGACVRCTDEVSPRSALKRFLGLTALVATITIRELVTKTPVAANFFSPLGMITTVAALPLVVRGLRNTKKGTLSLENFLGASIVAAVVAGEAAAALEILWVTSGAELLEGWITERSRRAIRDILQVSEKDTYILVDGVEVSVPVAQVKPGDTVVLHTGEKIAVDGVVARGQALVDESSITGRAEFVPRTEGDEVFAGTFVRQGVIFVTAQAVGDKTYLSRILTMVEDSLENKAPIEGVADRLAVNLVKAGFLVTGATFLLTWDAWRAFSVMLVMACPCATILSASSAISAAINAAARRHILIKGGRYLEEAGKATIVCFDKTGTLTTNRPEVMEIIPQPGLHEDEVLKVAYSTEIHNNHPVATAIKDAAATRDIEPVQHDVCDYILGKGVQARIEGQDILVGSHKLMEQFGVASKEVQEVVEARKKSGLTIIFVARDGKLMGTIGIANRDRDNAEELVTALKRDGIRKTVMITGDDRYSARVMCRRLDMDHCHYSVLPEEKSKIVEEIRMEDSPVLMVGDGINDALALATADVGIAMGAGGSEVAIEAADIALVRDDLHGVYYVRCLSQQTISVVHQNFWLATGSNVLGVILGALGLLSPVMAGMIHVTHSLGILANSSRLLWYEAPPLGGTRPVKKDF